MTFLSFTLNLVCALLLGAAIGSERAWRKRLAGTRTNSLVSTSAAVFVMCGLLLPIHDPDGIAKILAQVVTGVGFLGAGVIFKDGTSVRGLNTAATIWASAAVGTLCGLGFVGYACVMALAIIFINTSLRPLAYRLNPPEADTHYRFSIVCGGTDEAQVRALLVQHAHQLQIPLLSLRVEPTADGAQVTELAHLKTAGRNDRIVEELVGKISVEPSVRAVTWHVMRSTDEHRLREAV